jgi:GT2 family glycosyltransferase
MAAPPVVSIVVPTFQRPDALTLTLERLMAVRYPMGRMEVIVVDDGPDPSTELAVSEFRNRHIPVRYLPQANCGAARARNHGAEKATGDLLLFLDDDILVEPDHLERHLAAREGVPDAMVNGEWDFEPALYAELAGTPFGRFRLLVEEWVKSGIHKDPLDDVRSRPTAVTACNLAVSSTTFKALGGFDETFPFAGCEDQEFSMRAAARDASFIYDRSIRLLHNDRRSDLRSFCERQRRGALTAVHLASVAPSEFARPMIAENAPPTRSDGPKLAARKAVKWVLSRDSAISAWLRAIRVLERLGTSDRILHRIYWAMTGLYIFRGVRDGYRRLNAR